MMALMYLSMITLIMLILYRRWKLYGDRILNPEDDPFLAFAEQERKRRKTMFSPWVTEDLDLLALANEYFPTIALPQIKTLAKPIMTPVKIAALKDEPHFLTDQTEYFIAVGGPPAAMVAFEQAKKGKPVLYVNNTQYSADQNTRPIWAGAAFHGEADVVTQAPSFITWQFFGQELKRWINPPRYDNEVVQVNFPWLTLNSEDWLRHPLQVITGLRVAWGNYRLTKPYSILFEEMHERVNDSSQYLEAFNNRYGKILRDVRGSLIVAPDEKTWFTLHHAQQKLATENRILRPITAKEAMQKYGVNATQAFGLMEKTHDFILEPNFLEYIITAIKAHGGEVMNHWHLHRVWVDEEKNQGSILEFSEKKSSSPHYRKCTSAHLSLGSTVYHPNLYDLVSVTGASINALVFGARLANGPIVCGGSENHIAIVPLAEPVLVDDQYISFIRIAVGGSVGPLNRSPSRWYSYPGQNAVNALHCLRQILPEKSTIKVLSVIGCNRLVGKDGRQVEFNPIVKLGRKKRVINNITLQMGAGGGGLTQMGAIPIQIAKRS